MAAQFEALGDFLDDYLELPVRGNDSVQRMYRIPSPSAEDGLRIEKITTVAAKLYTGGAGVDTTVLDDEEERDLYRMCLGEAVYTQMLAEVPWSRFRHAAMTAMFWITSDRDMAAKYWASDGDPSRLAPNRAARRQQQQGSSESAAANTTRSRGSTSGTRAGSRRRNKGASGGAARR